MIAKEFRAIVAAAFLLLLTGCAAMQVVPGTPDTNHAGLIQGRVHGGLQPVVGAKVYLLEATTAGYGNAAKPLLTSATGSTADSIGYSVTTDTNGNFSITGDYTCDAGLPVYLLVKGGNSGSGTNNSIGLMTILGACPSSTPFTFAATVPFLYVNEVTTAATAYSLAGFFTDPTSLSASSRPQALLGLQHAAANFTNLVDVATGIARTQAISNADSIAPTRMLNTIADILAACINTTDATPTACSTLFANALSGGATGTTPTDTAAAAINLAHNPAVSTAIIGNLYGLQAGVGAPYLPNVTTVPKDYLLGIVYTAYPYLDSVANLGIDSTGTIWVESDSDTGPSMVSLASNGKAGATFTILTGPNATVVDTQDNVWTQEGTLTGLEKHSSAGVPATNSPFPDNGMGSPPVLTVDAAGSIWSTYSTRVNKFNADGTPATGSPFTATEQTFAGSAAAVGSNIWFASGVSSHLFSLTSSGAASTSFANACIGSNAMNSISIDGSGNFFIPFFGGLCIASSTGTQITPSAVSIPNLSAAGSAIDGDNHFFAATDELGIVEVSNTGTVLSPSAMYASEYFQTNTSIGIAIDSSGTVWTTDVGAGRVIQLIGLATPVVTPLAANLKTPYGGATINKP